MIATSALTIITISCAAFPYCSLLDVIAISALFVCRFSLLHAFKALLAAASNKKERTAQPEEEIGPEASRFCKDRAHEQIQRDPVHVHHR